MNTDMEEHWIGYILLIGLVILMFFVGHGIGISEAKKQAINSDMRWAEAIKTSREREYLLREEIKLIDYQLDILKKR